MMRHQSSKTVIPELLDEPSTIKLMQPGALQARRIPDIVNITSRN